MVTIRVGKVQIESQFQLRHSSRSRAGYQGHDLPEGPSLRRENRGRASLRSNLRRGPCLRQIKPIGSSMLAEPMVPGVETWEYRRPLARPARRCLAAPELEPTQSDFLVRDERVFFPRAEDFFLPLVGRLA